MNQLANWEWLENSVLAEGIQQWIWSYPLIETLHILGFSVLFGSVVMFDLRLLGFSRHLLVTDMAQHLLPWTYVSFGLVILSGFFLFAVDATAIATNPAFHLKLALILAASLNALVFQAVAFRSVKRWNRGVKAPIAVRAIAILSLILWSCVIVCGRLIAYV